MAISKAAVADGSGGTSFYGWSTNLRSTEGPQILIISFRLPNLILRSPNRSDTDALLRIFTDQRNVQYDKSCDDLDNRAAIENLITAWTTFKGPIQRANIVLEVDNKTVGTGGLGWINRSKTSGKMIGDAGLMLDSEYRGKGYAYEALRMVIDHAFRVLAMDEVHISCRDANVAFKGLVNIKFGFEAAPNEG